MSVNDGIVAYLKGLRVVSMVLSRDLGWDIGCP
jgi:hypothetical protein